jgi:gliding motility-associated-like protein
MQVFNRWGEQVFESFEVNVGWDGTFNGEQAPVDVYVYRVQYYAIREGVRTLVMNEKREVTLLR